MAGLQQLHTCLAGVKPLACAAQHTIVITAAEGMLQVSKRLGLIRVGGVGTQKTDGLHGIQSKTPGKSVGDITAVVDNSHYLLPCCRTNVRAVVQHAAHRCDGYARPFGNIVNIHVLALRNL